MDIKIIKEAIQKLENSDTTIDNVAELSYLYIVREYLNGREDNVKKELNDILPAYNDYINCKRKFQLHKDNSDSMIYCFRILCEEIEEFICSLYSGTTTGKERRYFNNMLSRVQDKLKN